MTSNGIEIAKENPESLRHLPELKVLRETFCSQQAVDRAAAHLQKNNPGLVQELLVEEGGSRSPAYANIAYYILDDLIEAGLDVPATSLGKMDLICELSRRLRKAYGLFEVPPRGKPLGEGPDKPLPPLVNLEVDKDPKRSGNVTQAMADKVLQTAYARRPDLWFATAEEHRHSMPFEATDEFRELLNQILDAEFRDVKNTWTPIEVWYEAIRRINKMCGIED